ncbi:FCGBP-like protein [Mya arenaria]|uniref:FCGBP-like protein n=1 Tax=Mya arenaria TaxID=6604 RepID=A0ABY7G353_MYAAR|nr:FCGBP-like protein [Mya arenaria]
MVKPKGRPRTRLRGNSCGGLRSLPRIIFERDDKKLHICANIIDNTFSLTGSYGKEFYVGFAEHFDHDASYRLLVDIASNTSGTLRVYNGYLGINTTYTFNRTRTIEFNKRLLRLGTGVYKGAGVHLLSDVDIAVYVTNRYTDIGSSDTYTALSLDGLGNRYVVASNSPHMYDSSLFLVVATADLTQVNVTFANGTRTHRSLNRYDVYQEVSRFDLTGTVVYSSKPVAAISGLGCSYSPNIHYVSGGCDHYITSLVPPSNGSLVVIVPSIYSHEKYIARVLSDSTNDTSTICHHYHGNQSICGAFSRSNVLDSSVESQALVVTGSEKFNVGYMTSIPGIGQYLNEYVFVLPTIYVRQSNYISVIIPTVDISGLILDGSLNPHKRLSETVPSPFSNYSVVTFDMNIGYHTIKHSNPAVKFGVICFGIGKLSIDDGTARTDWCETRPCFHGSRCVSGVNGYTCVCSMGYGGQRCENKMSSSAICYSCADMSHPGLCDTVTQCAPGQVVQFFR